MVIDYDVAGEDPYFEKVLENQVTPVGKKIIIEVKANGYPEPRVTFYHNRSVVHNDDRKIIGYILLCNKFYSYYYVDYLFQKIILVVGVWR